MSKMSLQKLAKEITDVTEPASMEKVFLYLQEIQDEDDEFMEMLFEKLQDQEVTWEQPWYQVSTSLTRKLKDINDNEAEQYRTDTISKDEDEKIRKNWRKLMKKYDLPDKLISFARWRNKDRCRHPSALEERVRRYVAAYLARGLQRPIYQIFKHIMAHPGVSTKRKYSIEEEKIMEVCFLHKPNRAVTYLTAILCREPRGIYKRYEVMFNGKPEKKRLKWNLQLATKFLNSLMNYSNLSLEELKYQKFDKSIWLKLQDDMEQQYIYLQKFWYISLHVQLFVKYDVRLNRLKIKTLKILRNSSYKVWTDIRWKEIVKHFPEGYTHLFLYTVCANAVKSYPNYLKAPLEDVIQHGLKRARMIRYRNRRLKTLKLNDQGALEKVFYHIKESDN